MKTIANSGGTVVGAGDSKKKGRTTRPRHEEERWRDNYA
jgi:hypothetical protein